MWSQKEKRKKKLRILIKYEAWKLFVLFCKIIDNVVSNHIFFDQSCQQSELLPKDHKNIFKKTPLEEKCYF